jgi:hypothetical protein
MSIDIFRLFVAHGEFAEVVNAEAERSGFERYPSHGFLLAMLDGAMDRLMKVADKGLLYRLHSDDDELVMSRERRSSWGSGRRLQVTPQDLWATRRVVQAKRQVAAG